MTKFREDLIDRMIRIYGFENPLVIQFTELCGKYSPNEWNDKCLKTLVEAHEEFPQLDFLKKE